MSRQPLVRSFLAFDISPEMREELSGLIALLSPKAREVKWVQPDLMHCTLRFFGDVEESLLTGELSTTIAREVSHQAPVPLIGRGVSAFPNWRYPKVIWAGLVGDTEALVGLRAKLEPFFTELGIEPDPRQLRLHLTLGRVKGSARECAALMQLIEKLTDREFGEILVKELVLYRSDLTPEGPNYTVLRTFPFGGGA